MEGKGDMTGAALAERSRPQTASSEGKFPISTYKSPISTEIKFNNTPVKKHPYLPAEASKIVLGYQAAKAVADRTAEVNAFTRAAVAKTEQLQQLPTVPEKLEDKPSPVKPGRLKSLFYKVKLASTAITSILTPATGGIAQAEGQQDNQDARPPIVQVDQRTQPTFPVPLDIPTSEGGASGGDDGPEPPEPEEGLGLEVAAATVTTPLIEAAPEESLEASAAPEESSEITAGPLSDGEGNLVAEVPASTDASGAKEAIAVPAASRENLPMVSAVEKTGWTQEQHDTFEKNVVEAQDWWIELLDTAKKTDIPEITQRADNFVANMSTRMKTVPDYATPLLSKQFVSTVLYPEFAQGDFFKTNETAAVFRVAKIALVGGAFGVGNTWWNDIKNMRKSVNNPSKSVYPLFQWLYNQIMHEKHQAYQAALPSGAFNDVSKIVSDSDVNAALSDGFEEEAKEEMRGILLQLSPQKLKELGLVDSPGLRTYYFPGGK